MKIDSLLLLHSNPEIIDPNLIQFYVNFLSLILQVTEGLGKLVLLVFSPKSHDVPIDFEEICTVSVKFFLI